MPTLTTNQVCDILLQRSAALHGYDLSAGKDLDKECGYVIGDPLAGNYRALFDRHGLAARVVSVYPDECWTVPPTVSDQAGIKDSPFEAAWDALEARHGIWTYLHRADLLSGIGHYGVLFLGLDDGLKLDQPAAPGSSRKVTFLRPLDESLVRIGSYEGDQTNPRFGQPVTYQVTFQDPTLTVPGSDVLDLTNQPVHYSRVIHLADNRLSSEVCGVPRMKPVLNYLFDLRKVLGGSAEMFWKGAFPGLSIEALPNLAGEAEIDEESLKTQVEAYSKGLQRYLALVGMSAKSLAPQVADPTHHVTQQLLVLCASLGVPTRIFLGTEAAHLASTQDAGTWNRRLMKRQNRYLTPMVIRPLIDRLIDLGVLPKPSDNGYKVNWNDMNAMSDVEKADIALKQTQTFQQYVTGGVHTLIPPTEFLSYVCGYDPDVVAEIVTAADAFNADQALEKAGGTVPVPAPPEPALPAGGAGGNQTGNPPKAPVGRPVGVVEGVP